MIFLFVLLVLVSFMGEQLPRKNKLYLMSFLILVLAWGAGTRVGWPDQLVYEIGFNKHTPILWDWNWSDQPFGYREKGFFLLGVICKTITNDSTFFLLTVSFITFYFLYKDFKKYSIVYPLLGLCVYVARFFAGRNLMQIRAGLCYAIVLLGVQYVTKRDWKRYFLIIFIAYLFHTSALVAIPLYFLPYLRLKKKHVVLLIILAFIITGFFTPVLRGLIVDTGSDLDASLKGVRSYITEDEQQSAKGLANPMIYFQTFLLMAYVFGERILKKTTVHYYTIRDAYFYSTFILITFSMFLTLSARTSTMFATFEFVIIPSLIESFGKKNKWLTFAGVAIVLIAIMYMNLGARAFDYPRFK